LLGDGPDICKPLAAKLNLHTLLGFIRFFPFALLRILHKPLSFLALSGLSNITGAQQFPEKVNSLATLDSCCLGRDTPNGGNHKTGVD
jgi:hypothetical protein